VEFGGEKYVLWEGVGLCLIAEYSEQGPFNLFGAREWVSSSVSMFETFFNSKSYSKSSTKNLHTLNMLCNAVIPVAATDRLIPGCRRLHIQLEASKSGKNPKLGKMGLRQRMQDSAFQEPGPSKERIFHGTGMVAIQYYDIQLE
jgi:hypothetical protein